MLSRATVSMKVGVVMACLGMVILWPEWRVALQGITYRDGIHFAPVGPSTETEILAVWDTDDRGVGGPDDMNGSRIGTVRYRQEDDGRLALHIQLVFAHPNTTYQVFLVCGPSHEESCNFITIGEVATDAAGMGAGSFVVPVALLQASPFGPGYRTDHIDLLQEVGDRSRGFLAAGALNYHVPGPPQSEAEAATSGPLDPGHQ
jgi:hypothetical protein